MLGLRDLSDHSSPAPRRGLSEPKANPSPGLSNPGMMDGTQETGVERAGGSTCREAVLGGGGKWDRESPRHPSTDSSGEAGMQSQRC